MAEVQRRIGAKPRDGAPPAASPAYFLSLTVSNFRCFKQEQTLDLSDGNGRPARWTVLLGENGVGKTTLLQCLAAIHPNSTAEIGALRGAPALLGGNLMPEAVMSRFLHEHILGGGRGVGVVRGVELRARIRCGMSLGGDLTGRVEEFVVREEDYNLRVSGPHPPIEGVDCYGYGAARHTSETSLSRRGGSGIETLFSDTASLINAEEWLLQADYAASKESASRGAERRDHVMRMLIKLLPDVTDLRIAVYETSSLMPGVEAETPYGWVPIRALSLGYCTLVAWTVDLASRLFERHPESPNPLAEPAVVLVDEVDLHLHPRWQRSLISYLTDLFPNVQFIVTAHSPLVVQAAQDANVVLLRREGDHVVIDNDVESIRGWRVDQILTSDLFGLTSARPPQLDALLAERTKILKKARLTAGDRKRLQELEAAIGKLPAGETPEDLEAMDIIRRAAELLKKPAPVP